MVAFLSKSDASVGFDQIIDFLNAHTIQYALVLHALIDGKKVVVTEDVIRRDLHLDDADGVECLPNEEIFVELARMVLRGLRGMSLVVPWHLLSSAMLQEEILTSPNAMPIAPLPASQDPTPTPHPIPPQDQPFIPPDSPPQEQPTTTSESLICRASGRIDQEEVNAASKGVSAAEPTVFDDEEVTMIMAQTLIKLKEKKAKLLDEQIAQNMHDEEVQKAAAREKQEKDDMERAQVLQKHVSLATLFFLEKDYPLSNAVMILMLSAKLQVKEDNEMARDLVMKIFMEANKPKSRSLDTSSKKYQSLKKKPISIAQARKNMIIYLKNMAGYKMEHFRGMTYDKATTTIKKVNDDVQLHALIDGKKVVVTEDVIRRDLHLDDADGVECLPNEEIFVELARMGYEKPPPKLTFYKAFFFAQWKFLIHTLV
nr:hypothetical protein [Tanacetum cinerariifolium]